VLVGDGTILGNAHGGNDIFVFTGAFGFDSVQDFHQGEDKLEFHVPGIATIADLEIVTVGGNTVITADSAGAVTLADFTSTVTPDDLIFV
jgi:hypothetical protein